MSFKVVKEQASVVAVGHFNPSIFHPMWFAKHGLLPTSEAEAAELGLTHPELSQFKTPWLVLQAQRQRFIAQTEDPSFEMSVSDLVQGTFSVLEHTPVTSLGINRLIWAQFDDEKTWHAFGHALAPKKPWDGLMENPGTSRVTMVSWTRKDGLPGRLVMTMEHVEDLPRGVLLNINHDLRQDGDATLASTLMNTLASNYERLQAECREALPRLIAQALEGAS